MPCGNTFGQVFHPHCLLPPAAAHRAADHLRRKKIGAVGGKHHRGHPHCLRRPQNGPQVAGVLQLIQQQIAAFFHRQRFCFRHFSHSKNPLRVFGIGDIGRQLFRDGKTTLHQPFQLFGLRITFPLIADQQRSQGNPALGGIQYQPGTLQHKAPGLLPVPAAGRKFTIFLNQRILARGQPFHFLSSLLGRSFLPYNTIPRIASLFFRSPQSAKKRRPILCKQNRAEHYAFYRAALAFSTSAVKAAASLMASSESILRFRLMPAFFRPFMN